MKVIYDLKTNEYIAITNTEFEDKVEIKNYEDYGSFCDYDAYFKGQKVEVINSLSREDSLDDAFENVGKKLRILADKYDMSVEDKKLMRNILTPLEVLADKDYE